MTESHPEEAKQLLSHGWSASDVSHFLALREYKQRWGGANLDREERLFLRKAESVLLQAGLGPSRQEGGRSSLRRSSGATTSQLPAISNSSSFVALDFETANYSRDSACSLAIIRVESLKVVSRTYRLIKPPSSHFMFTDIHGDS